jgi:hypothetical protein
VLGLQGSGIEDGGYRVTDTQEAPLITHPEEMRASYDLHVGKSINLKGTGRLTPAGIVSGGLMVVAVLVATTALVRAVRR